METSLRICLSADFKTMIFKNFRNILSNKKNFYKIFFFKNFNFKEISIFTEHLHQNLIKPRILCEIGLKPSKNIKISILF